MYPFFRIVKELVLYGKPNSQSLFEEYVSHHLCWPWDLDVWLELNNGRTLTIFDLGRVPLVRRVGLHGILKKNNWSFTVAGSSIRYQRKISVFDKLKMHSRIIGWDNRFLYVTQTILRSGTPTTNVLIRVAIVSSQGIVSPEKVIHALDNKIANPNLPVWIKHFDSTCGPHTVCRTETDIPSTRLISRCGISSAGRDCSLQTR